MKLKCLSVFGTRPEAIKMAPLINALKRCDWVDSRVCVTAQHREMLDQVLRFFDISVDFDLNVMSPDQSVSSVASKILQSLRNVLVEFKPDLVLVHGDTISTFSAALAAYLESIPVAHIEAGLRTENIYSPWPEEGMRRMVSPITEMHFAPTELARKNLLKEGVAASSIYITGNTVVDALLHCVKNIEADLHMNQCMESSFPFLQNKRKFILVTGHRRENFGFAMMQICSALESISKKYPDIDVVYPVHPNPRVSEPVKKLLKGIDNIYLIDPLGYREFVYFMRRSHIVVTDSGGIQEEAPALGKPVLVMRETTERPEAIESGNAKLVGTEIASLLSNVGVLLEDQVAYSKMSEAVNPYGDGKASEKIVRVIEQWFKAKRNV